MVIYLILFLGLLNWMCFMSSRVLMSLYAIELGASAAAIGALIALYGLGPLLLSVHAGKVADRVGSFRPIVLGSAGLAAGLAIPYFFAGFAVLYAAALIIGIALVFLNIALQHLIAGLGDAEERTRNVSLQSLAIALATTRALVMITLRSRGCLNMPSTPLSVPGLAAARARGIRRRHAIQATHEPATVSAR
jgi:MFS family permease